MSPEQRRLNMSRVRGKDTSPEMIVRRGLHARGLRYRLHVRELPGRPDLVFPRYKTAMFIHGCFWHKHTCEFFSLPKTRPEFWAKKLEDNVARDRRAISALHEDGWRVAVIWECSLRRATPAHIEGVMNRVARFIRSGRRQTLELRGPLLPPKHAAA